MTRIINIMIKGKYTTIVQSYKRVWGFISQALFFVKSILEFKLYIAVDIRNYTCYNVYMIRKGATKDANDIKLRNT